MSSKTKKGELIEKILKITKADPEKYIDVISDHSEEYLEKLLKVCEKLKVSAV